MHSRDSSVEAPPARVTGVIWITGFSGAGKTTVARKVHQRLTSRGVSAVLLDGDDLRAIFGGRWKYDREERIELARVYFRLCSHLASQGLTVIIAAVAMYDEVREWVRSYIPGSLEVYLRVPDEERRRRDQSTKRVYETMGDVTNLYDEPVNPDMTVDNYGAETPEHAADSIVARFLRGRDSLVADLGRATHWEAYYSTAKAPTEPSSFARKVGEDVRHELELLEVGCGNGRDAAHFARLGHHVTALDVSHAAITLCAVAHAELGVRFLCGSLPDVADRFASRFDAVYSRFCLHAMTRSEQEATLRAALRVLKSGGQLFVEARSINDPLARLGEVISPTERIHGHYRRFIVLDELLQELTEMGFNVVHQEEVKGVAAFGDDDPVVVRVVAQKPR